MSASKLVLCAFFLLSASAGLPARHIFNVFGSDQRQMVTSTEYPWSAVGFLSTGCTGTLVDRNIVITAAHCVLDGDSPAISPNLTTFSPNMINNSSSVVAGMSHVWYGTSNPDGDRAHDWAIIQLDTNLGDTFGFMNVSPATSSQVTLAGYSGDLEEAQTASVHIGCWLRELTYGMYFHDCDAARGSSGGPMFVMGDTTATIVAINVAEFRDGDTTLDLPAYRNDYANIAVPASTFLPKLREISSSQ